MPGTLMFEGCLQAMALYMAAMGVTLPRDGWRFEPVPDVSYPLRCRGQALPDNKEVVYEVFVDEFIAGPIPTLWADILCTVDGLRAFHCRRMGLRLSPGWPLDDPAFVQQGGPSTPWPALIDATVEPEPVASIGTLPLDFRALMATAWGPPSAAFGPMYARFDGPTRVARLPGPPYHFMSRVTAVDQPPGLVKAGVTVELAWDIPASGFYFAADRTAAMPFCVFLEAALQPCGWLASYVGCATTAPGELFFRNLDGTGTWHEPLGPDAGTLRTTAKLTSVSRSGGMILVSFDVHCDLHGRRVYDLQTGFGFFPAAALANQAGLPAEPRWSALLQAPKNSPIELLDAAPAWFGRLPALPDPDHDTSLLMLDRVTLADPDGGEAGLGRYLAEHDVEPSAWFFKAHFFSDPVQPGSLGLESMSQLLRFAALHQDLAAAMSRPRFVAATARPMTWKYRGQVIPTDTRVRIGLELTAVQRDDERIRLSADATLWVDGRRIYEATGVNLDIVDDGAIDV